MRLAMIGCWMLIAGFAAGMLVSGLLGDAAWLQALGDHVDASDWASAGVVTILLGALALTATGARIRIRL